MSLSDPPPRRQPIFNLPPAVSTLLTILVGVHLVRAYLLSASADAAVILNAAFFPVRFTNPEAAELLLPAMAGARYWMFLTYGLLHADFMHLAVNTVWMAAFASPLARRFGTTRFLLFTGLGAIGGAVAHLLVNFGDPTPMVGASAAISAHMAAVCRFAFQPGAALSGYVVHPALADRLPAPPLTDMIRNRRALIFLVVWFGINLAFGLGVGDVGSGSIAWQAHIGGFVIGLLAFQWFDPIRRPQADGEAG